MEKKNGLNPNDPGDASSYKPDNRYTNIEMFLGHGPVVSQKTLKVL